MVSFHENPVRRRVLVGLLFSVLRRPGDWDWWDEGVLGPRSQWLRRWSGAWRILLCTPFPLPTRSCERGLGSAHSLTERCRVLTAGAGLATLRGNIFPVSDSMWAPLLRYCKGIITPLLRRSPGRRGWGPSAAAQERGDMWSWSADRTPDLDSVLSLHEGSLAPSCAGWPVCFPPWLWYLDAASGGAPAAPPNALCLTVGMLPAEPRMFPAVASSIWPR